MKIRLPTLNDRVSIIGSTGSGKSTFGAYLLSHARLDKQPFYILDYKNEELLNSIPNIREIRLGDRIPKQPGLYISHLRPETDDDIVEKFFWKVLDHERVGLFFDEAYMLPKGSKALSAILTQGRSKRIPAYSLTQRPAWVQRFVFSEANFFSVFRLTHFDDEKTIQKFIRMKDKEDEATNVSLRLPDFQSRWYDVGRDKAFVFNPVPPAEEIISAIGARLPKKRSFF